MATSPESISVVLSVPPLPPPVRSLKLTQIEEGTARSLILEFDIKKRTYYGNTTMDAEMSLLMANQALVRPSPLPLRSSS